MMSTYLSKILFFTKKIIVLFTVFATLSANMSFALTPVSLSNQDYFKITKGEISRGTAYRRKKDFFRN